MKIWFDILTPKQLLFFEPMVKKLEKNHNVLCTSRSYSEVSNLAKIRQFDLKIVGKHGGGEKFEKLKASLERTEKLLKIVKGYSPDALISFCSPEASRISFGLGIYHIAFSDSPHALAVMKLTVPFVQKLLIPWVIPKSEFTKYGIDSKDIISYKAIDAASISKRVINQQVKLPFDSSVDTIVVRAEENQAAYSSKINKSQKIIEYLLRSFKDKNIIVLSRYTNQRKILKNKFGNRIKILNMSYDGKVLLKKTNVFIGAGGTMTAESALLGIPTISYGAYPNIIEDFLIKKKLVRKETDPKKVISLVRNYLKIGSKRSMKKAASVLEAMEDPFMKLNIVLKSLE